MSDPITYRCPAPGCTWALTDQQRPNLSAAVLRTHARKVAGTGGQRTVEIEMELEHRALLQNEIARHLLEHVPEPERVQGTLEARVSAGLVIDRTRARKELERRGPQAD